MNSIAMKRRSAFTLVEIMIVLICTALLMGPIFLVLRSSTRTSLRGMLRIDTTLEARRVIKQVYADLKMACFPLPYNSIYNFDDVMQVSGTPPHNSYKFYSFPIHQRLNDIFSSQLSGVNFRDVAEVHYRVEDSKDPDNPFMKLIRTEAFGGKVNTRVLTDRINFFEIKPVMMQPYGKNQFYFLVTLQLIDAVHPSEMKGRVAGAKLDELQKDVILADFFDVVYPEFFHAAWNQTRVNPNWHTQLRSPAAP
ncbi:MAG TPA: type II secretion system protein [Candidatus Rifleibacterium sp.]|nr:type II secretion system protein [Candidatus Rifleibacterium sp.]HPT44963.1 type II secretion system protein [Candidatus Rifleibacterium sp.]